MTTIAYLSAVSPSKIGDMLTQQGFVVHEALSVSEISYLCEHYPIDVVMIAHDVETLGDIKGKHITIHLKQSATIGEIVWELTNLFPANPVPLQ